MREILYVQAGNFSNFVGTHFWNTQEAYTLDEDSSVQHDISFRTSSSQGQMLCPRLLMFDWRGNWGTLNRSNSLGQRSDQASQPKLWSGAVQEFRHAPIPRSAYHEYISQDGEMDDAMDVDASQDAPPTPADIGLGDEAVRYWSDYTRVYYTPNTIQQVPEPERGGEGGDPNGNWGLSAGVYTKYDEAHDLMEDSVRLSLEECDSIQGLQILNDVDSFGGFIASFLTAFKDDYSKIATLAFPVLSGVNVVDPDNFDTSNTKKVQEAMTDALYLRALHDLGSLTVPLQPPEAYNEGVWRDSRINSRMRQNPYYSSAFLSAYIESATLPLRLGDETVSSFAAKIGWQSPAPYAELLGSIPLLPANLGEQAMGTLGQVNLSQGWCERLEPKPRLPERFSAVQVLRGFSDTDVRLYDVLASSRLSSAQSATRYGAPAYPLPSSFPVHIWAEDYVQRTSPPSAMSVKGFASIMGSQAGSEDSAPTSLKGLFKGYAIFAEGCLKRRDEKALEGVGVDVDEVRELVNDLWGVVDGFGGGE